MEFKTLILLRQDLTTLAAVQVSTQALLLLPGNS